MADVSTHFRIPILGGQSTFTVRVPHHYLQGQRQFFFSQLHLVPNYFSLDAEKEQLDADPEMEQMIEKDVHVKININEPQTFFAKEPYVNKATIPKLVDAMAAINAYFESKKPAFVKATPLFIDWIDIVAGQEMDITEYVPAMALIYYNKPYNATEHLDYAPSSIRDIEAINNFMPPLGTMDSVQNFAERIRLRFWMGPFTKAIFSSKEPFATDFGFLESQLGTYDAKLKQYHLNNDSPHWRPMMLGRLAPKLTLTRATFKVHIQAVQYLIEGTIRKIQIKKKDWFDNEKLLELLKEKFKQTSRFTNTIFSIEYDKDNKKFYFEFPNTDALGVTIGCEPEFAHRLGFGTNTLIMKGMQAMPQEDRLSIVDAKKKALTVVYDTGPLLCTLDQMSSNTTSGALDHYMAALYPHESGILSMPQSMCSCTSNLTPIHALTQASAALVPVPFRLLRIYEDQSISDFAWKCNAYIYGVLQGTCKKV